MPISFSSPGERDSRTRGHGVTAVLGPTNTGKTHLAIERMLAHSSGLIGLPLRLLAREVYNKVMTGPARMPLRSSPARRRSSRKSPLLGVDKSRRCHAISTWLSWRSMRSTWRDLDRGRIFTDRMLNCRGREETLVLGAATVADVESCCRAPISSAARVCLARAPEKRDHASAAAPPSGVLI